LTLSTVDSAGYPDARVVILKDIDSRGWHFAIRSDSPKGIQISQNNHVALTFFWPEVGRSIRIRGKAVLVSEEECRQDFGDRPVGSKIAALASRQSEVLGDREELMKKVEDVTRSVEEGEQGGLDWRVYAVEPDVVEFWQGSSDRLHHRVRFSRGEGDEGWVKELLWP
jgi:pyridoxamine 5'-phosphate oxidase